MAMKWIELATCKKEPPFNQEMLIWSDDRNGSETWYKAEYLEQIKHTKTGKEYIFIVDGVGEKIATHYCIPEPPKNNQ